ncbi:fad binding domain-containing protein [Phaffia rhodozyma]|uniref:Fad binding domain-containing protein n=1 Tax=Phaffia rhodozyma TaxID=264483 RepID=A0A0F7SKB7_PHARH|nr:fad binding domain-containing protein [Phaffia rhodozyma]
MRPLQRKIVRSLPSELPVLLIGGGLANLSLAQTFHRNGLVPKVDYRIFDSYSATSKPNYSLTLHEWSLRPMEKLFRKKNWLDKAAVDRAAGGVGMVESKIFDLESGKPVGELELENGGRSVRANRGSLKDLLTDGLEVEYKKVFKRFEHVKDGTGREGIQAFFDDGSHAFGSALIGADGVHSTVRKQLLPSVEPTVSPVVCFTGQWTLPSPTLLTGPIPYHLRVDNDTYRVDVASYTAFSTTYNRFDKDKAQMQWIYLRLPTGSDDPLWTPDRSLDKAREIPDELYIELEDLGKKTEKEYSRFVLGVKKGDGDAQYNWLMRCLRLPPLDELNKLKSQVEGGDRVFLIGDAAHAMPIFMGDGGNHALKDGHDLGQVLSKVIRAQDQAHYESRSTEPKSSEPVLTALREFEAGALDRWGKAVDKSELRLLSLFKPIEEWRTASGVEAGEGEEGSKPQEITL